MPNVGAACQLRRHAVQPSTDATACDPSTQHAQHGGCRGVNLGGLANPPFCTQYIYDINLPSLLRTGALFQRQSYYSISTTLALTLRNKPHHWIALEGSIALDRVHIIRPITLWSSGARISI